MNFLDIVVGQFGRGGVLLDDSADLERIRRSVHEGVPVILRRVWPTETIDTVRVELNRRAAEDFREQVDITKGCPNFIRLDNEEKRSRFIRDHQYRRFYGLPWNYDPNCVFDQIGRELVTLRNLILNQPNSAFIDEPYAPYYAHWTSIQYPPGGGFLAEHEDVCEPGAELECLLTMSQFGEDFSRGGLYVRDAEGDKLYVDPLLNKGDLLIFNQSLPHGIDPVDLETEIDWRSSAGRWSMFIPVRPTPWN